MRLATSLLLAVGLSAPALAHHGWGSYDADRPITITAAIQAVSIQNPHGEMTLPYQGKGWLVTLAPPSRMTARGATDDLLKVGANVTAHGYPKRDGTPEIRAEWIEIAGKRYQLR